ncbi:MAG TPA: D-aminoacyl-tRNA deacylase [Ilumatobacter sp.]|nr:D-aminoacyl-tRNA deacylase [Ilumatobacter sp.]
MQRVTRARVVVLEAGEVAGELANAMAGEIGAGLCVLVGVTHDDTPQLAQRMADKIWFLRVLDDAEGVMNRSLADVAGDGGRAEALVVSQFTLYGSTDKGRRPSWIAAAAPEQAEPLVDAVVARLRTLGCTVATGRFRTEMHVELVNDGPVTLMLET